MSDVTGLLESHALLSLCLHPPAGGASLQHVPFKPSNFSSFISAAPQRYGVLLTADVQVYGVAPLAVRVLEAAVQPVVAQVHLGQDEPRALEPVRRLDVGAIHLPRHRGVVVQGAALHGDVAAHLAVLVPSHCKHTTAGPV